MNKKNEKFGLNNSVCRRDVCVAHSSVREYVNVYSVAEGLLIKSSNTPDENATFCTKSCSTTKVQFPKIITDNLDPSETVEMEEIDVATHFIKCKQKNIIEPLPGIIYKNKKPVLTGKYIKTELMMSQNGEGLLCGNVSVDAIFPDKTFTAIIHNGKTRFIEIIPTDAADAAGIEAASYETAKKYYGFGMRQSVAETCCYKYEFRKSVKGETNVIPMSKVLAKHYGHQVNNRIILNIRIYENGLMIVPSVKKSAVSGKELNSVETPVKEIKVCESCAESIESGNGEGTDEISMLIKKAEEFLNTQKNLYEEIAELRKKNIDLEKRLNEYGDIINELLGKDPSPIHP